ncbi:MULTISPECIES: 4-amino-4-deoxy-L-arabinose-phosphoundecaprenol flippase subunit ArnE [Enterobacter]|uniref:Probable 4-amino-4-deoxy-L-arabinose-phosphoundecaprenol flippase subunit ArnE n=1 Tax=Enterobacter nematophilus TaxID=2994648 RepID=A0ABT3W1I8_9ENTR|nr:MULTISPECIES: 4-amino-4-deoxy-L-arabinose-phosphoundecaprenol flippase subunit ArnE [Enterobacter]MCX5575926.1 4-amino-4-deoxy-L-arabinose-phosphoundecaprenol flippase subunit ArnE [Enterobacter nematophilus]HBU6132381.1 4-amino-4-deoxy-L-arabinose-phosphoundecaprenol flippase subunit ArnE [Enterobacter cloacae]
MAWTWLILASLLSCAGQLCQKQATRPAKDGRRGAHVMLWLGLAMLALGCGMLVWLAVLQRLPVGVAYPMLSLNFVWVTLAAKLFWREHVAAHHWLGVGFIIMGIIVLGGSL